MNNFKTNSNTVSVIVVFLLLNIFASNSNAVIFYNCKPNSALWEFSKNEQAAAHAKKREILRCEAENNVLQLWQSEIKKFENSLDSIRIASQTGNKKEFIDAWLAIEPSLKSLYTSVKASPNLNSSSRLRSLFSIELNYSFQNVGFTAPSSFDDALEKIREEIPKKDPNSRVDTLATTFLQQVISRTSDYATELSKSAGEKIKKETAEIYAQKKSELNEKLRGDSVSGYFGGFFKRLSLSWKPWLFFLVIVTFIASWIAIKRRKNPFPFATAAAAAYLLPGTIMALSFVILPFIPFWIVIPAMLLGTLAMYWYGEHVFEWIGNKVGSSSETAKRLKIIGMTIRNLREGIDSSEHTDEVSEMSTSKATHGSSRWGSVEEIISNEHLCLKTELPKVTGLSLARVKDAPNNMDQRFRHVGHVVTVAPNGSGKGIGAVIPNLLDYEGSCIVLDVKGENAAVTANAREKLGHKVFQIDPFNVNTDKICGFNVLNRINTNEADCVSESSMLTDALVISENNTGGSSQHFDESAKNLLQGLILHVSATANLNDRNLSEVRRLLTSDEETFLNTLASMAANENIAFGIPARSANTLMSMGDRERGSVLSTARRNTSFLDDPRVAASLSRNDFDFSEIKSELMTVYLVMPANKISINSRFVRLFVGSVIAAITSSSQQPSHRVAFILDEFAQLGYMKQIEDAVSLMRGYGLAFWVFLQDLSQLKGIYPRWQTFLANSAKTFFGTDDYDTAKYISDTLGQTTIEYETQTEGSNSGSGISGGGGSLNRGKSSGTSQQYAGRPLLTPDEVMRLGPEKPILLIKGEYPYKLDRLNYLVDVEYFGKADDNPYHKKVS